MRDLAGSSAHPLYYAWSVQACLVEGTHWSQTLNAAMKLFLPRGRKAMSFEYVSVEEAIKGRGLRMVVSATCRARGVKLRRVSCTSKASNGSQCA